MKSLRKLLQYLKPYMLFVVIGPTFMGLEVAMDLIQPAIMQHIIDVGIVNQDFNYVIKMGLLMIGTAVLGLIGGLGCMVYSTKAAVNFATDIRKEVFTKMETLSSKKRDAFGPGKLLTILTNDITVIQSALKMTLRVLVRGPLLFIGSSIIVFLTARELFPILLIVVPIVLLAIILIATKASNLFQKVQESLDLVNTKLQENFSGVRVIKAYVRQKYEISHFEKVNERLTSVNILAVQRISLLVPIITFAVNCGIVATLWMGSEKVLHGTLQVGAILAFINYLNIILMSLISISIICMQVVRAFSSADRVQKVLDTEDDVLTRVGMYKPEQVYGHVEFKNVSYSYSENNELVLKNISFTAYKGEKIGIIGSTGSGKSTLAKLIPRLYDVNQGELCIDGVNVKEYQLDTLRASISFVPQEAVLFSGNIEDNLRYGKEDATIDELELAATSACATEFIHTFENNYQYHITQGGTNLSGGQKQRLSIARALVKEAAILILDDVTSAVDVKSAAGIQESIQSEYGGVTIFLIASKISSIIDADRILVLDNGELVGNDTHDVLLTTCEVYQEIYHSQNGIQQQKGEI
ncbi:ABC transporter ATP-binding protein [Bacillus thuringiensis]|uniref:ABC transporter ATP-binding protein n=1 Tax=Bacillus thuringiensis TaxID=1428 RepID=UPI000786D9BF|nr:ABC transporter ATP-binding protein [Bacillus thuringiensis]HDR7713413.1 ABC transporter ATP-binding protein [Bacillus cereus]AMR88274.1 multidrug ABC transporter ATP-binding protein [Bacillus thuringiensis]MBG9636038.1 multidrug ABC transporter ATP-binding protein [Bacillus thuringiensis]MBG9675916.1 multidrug ABC transporter ATP-binding protein [Bacillus thuringiensis]MEC3298322.1 ABC transporter ATP-binding protein [Bacillus thuringiensis]